MAFNGNKLRVFVPLLQRPRVILNKVCFILGNGQKTGLVGQGKTTLMKIITGLEKCDGGICLVSGRIGYLAQHNPISNGSVMDFLSPAGKADYRVKKVMDVVGLADRHLEMEFRSLSGGEKTRKNGPAAAGRSGNPSAG